MTEQEIIELAREAGISLHFDHKFGRDDYTSVQSSFPDLQRFAEIVAKTENESCAKVCDSLLHEWDGTSGANDDYRYAYRTAIEGIRARRK